MRYQIFGTLVATGFLAMTAIGNAVLAAPPDGGSPITLAQAQQPATSTPAPGAAAPQSPTGPSTNMPGQMMEHGKEMGTMGKGMAPMMGGQGHPGPMGGTPPCPAGQAMSGTPSTCK